MSTEDGTLPPGDGRPPPRRDRTIWYVVGALVALWIGYLAVFGPGRPGPLDLSDPNLGAADFTWTLEGLDGRPVPLAAYRGRPIFLNIWATWCGPCLAEMPSIEALARNPRLDRVAFLAVSVDDREALHDFLRTRRPGLTVLRTPGTPPPPFLTDGIPATFLIAPDGRIAAAQVGAADWDDPAVVERLAGLSEMSVAGPPPAGPPGPAPGAVPAGADPAVTP